MSTALRVLFCMILARDIQLVEEPNIPCTMTIGPDLDASPSITLQFMATLGWRDQSYSKGHVVDNCLLNTFCMHDNGIFFKPLCFPFECTISP